EAPQEDSDTTPPPERTVVLEVLDLKTDTVALRINRQEVRVDELEARLSDIYKQRAEKVLFMQADDGIEFRKVADVMDIVHKADSSIRLGLMAANPRPAE